MGTGIAALDGTTFVRGLSAPDPILLAGLNGPTQAGLNNLTATADNLGFFYLEKRGAGVADREEQLGVHAKASSTITPSHQDRAPCIEGGASSTGVNLGGEPVALIRSLKANVSVNATVNAKSTSRADSPKGAHWQGCWNVSESVRNRIGKRHRKDFVVGVRLQPRRTPGGPSGSARRARARRPRAGQRPRRPVRPRCPGNR